MTDRLKVFTGTANPELAREICSYLDIPLSDAEVTTFADGEVRVKIDENIRGCDVFIVQPTCKPVNHNLMELLVMMDACRRASAQRITPVIPYFGYARQDRKDQPRVPISSKLVANLIVASGATRILCIDLHAAQIQGFFDIPVDHLFAAPVLFEYFKAKQLEDLVVISPDAGGVERTRAFAKRLNASLAIIDKRREGPNKAQVMNIVGEVKGKTAIMIDDMIDTAGTLTLGAEAVHQKGAAVIYATASHAVFSGDAVKRLVASPLKEVVVTNSIPVAEENRGGGRIVVLSVASLLGEAIYRIHKDLSVSSLFV